MGFPPVWPHSSIERPNGPCGGNDARRDAVEGNDTALPLLPDLSGNPSGAELTPGRASARINESTPDTSTIARGNAINMSPETTGRPGTVAGPPSSPARATPQRRILHRSRHLRQRRHRLRRSPYGAGRFHQRPGVRGGGYVARPAHRELLPPRRRLAARCPLWHAGAPGVGLAHHAAQPAGHRALPGGGQHQGSGAPLRAPP
jgi:hypothetical protein